MDHPAETEPSTRPSPPYRLNRMLGNLIFLSRWLQAPLYLGLIVAQTDYVFHWKDVNPVRPAQGIGA